MPGAYLALLRGVNVGGKNTLPMDALRDTFAAAGCRDVRTYIQSGNVIFRAEPDLVASLPGVIATQIAERFGYQTPVVLRTSEEIGEIIRHNPFLAEGAGEETLHVLFLAERPSARGIESLDPDRSPPDAFIVRGREIYLRLPNGAGRTKLTNAYFDAKLATTSTGRNWRTVTKLFALMES
jgi:uncharacterized protein (DUF1697 family)